MRSLTILFILSLSYQALSHTSWKATHKTKNCFYELRFATNDTTYFGPDMEILDYSNGPYYHYVDFPLYDAFYDESTEEYHTFGGSIISYSKKNTENEWLDHYDCLYADAYSIFSNKIAEFKARARDYVKGKTSSELYNPTPAIQSEPLLHDIDRSKPQETITVTQLEPASQNVQPGSESYSQFLENFEMGISYPIIVSGGSTTLCGTIAFLNDSISKRMDFIFKLWDVFENGECFPSDQPIPHRISNQCLNFGTTWGFRKSEIGSIADELSADNPRTGFRSIDLSGLAAAEVYKRCEGATPSENLIPMDRRLNQFQTFQDKQFPETETLIHSGVSLKFSNDLTYHVLTHTK